MKSTYPKSTLQMMRKQPWVYGLPEEAAHWKHAKIRTAHKALVKRYPSDYGFTCAKKRELIKDEKMAAKEYRALGFPRLSRDEARHARTIRRVKCR